MVFSHMHLCLYTLNFICHFIAQSLSPIRTFCNSSPFTTPLLKTNGEPVAPFSQERFAGSEPRRETHPCAKPPGRTAVTLFSGQTEHFQRGWARARRHWGRLPSTPPQKLCSLRPTRAWKHGEEQGRLALCSCTCCLGARLAMVQPHVC